MNIEEFRKELDEAVQYANYRKKQSADEIDVDMWNQIIRLNQNLKNLTKLIIHKGQ